MKLTNKTALYDYTILDRMTAGVVLTGSEVKSLRTGHGKLDNAFVKVMSGEAYLVNAEIMPYSYANPPSGGYDPKRTRKLLLHKKELLRLQMKLDTDHLTLVPLSWYTTGPHIKLEIGLARGKREYEKREKKRQADQKRELEIEFRGKIK
jgi:SsrA-binding protein